MAEAVDTQLEILNAMRTLKGLESRSDRLTPEMVKIIKKRIGPEKDPEAEEAKRFAFMEEIDNALAVYKRKRDPKIFANNDNLPHLVAAAHCGLKDRLIKLLDLGLDINTVSPYSLGSTALIEAVQNFHKDIVELLIKRKANVDYQEWRGDTALHYACRKSLEITALLLDAGASPFIRNEGGRVALHEAAACNNVACIELLIKKGVPIDIPDSRGGTPLSYAAIFGALDAVKYLVEKGADLEPCDAEGLNCLFHAMEEGHLAIVKYLAKTKLLTRSIQVKKILPPGFEAIRRHMAQDPKLPRSATVPTKTQCMSYISQRGDIASEIYHKKNLSNFYEAKEFLPIQVAVQGCGRDDNTEMAESF